MERTLVVSATSLLAGGFFAVPTDRKSRSGEPVNGLFAVARAIQRVIAFKTPARAVAVIDTEPHGGASWPELLQAQLGPLPDLLRALGCHVVEAAGEVHLVASYTRAALEQGDDVIIAAVDKRCAQLVGDRVWWYDANKDVRYTAEIVQKRFTVPPSKVAGWLALVGDDEALPGVKGIGAKGATALIEACGSVEEALARADTVEGRPGKALRAVQADVPRELERARLDGGRPLPLPLAEAAFAPAAPAALNERFAALGFTELLTTDGSDEVAAAVEVCQTADALAAALGRMGPPPVTVHPILEEPDPSRCRLVGVALASGDGPSAETCYVPVDGAAWPALAAWLADESIGKVGHDLLGLRVALLDLGTRLAGVTGDTACASHLGQPSNWAPHDLELVAKHVLGRALPEQEAVRGVGKKQKPWGKLPAAQVASFAAGRAQAAAGLWGALGPQVDGALLAEYLELTDTCARMERTGILIDPAALDHAEASLAAIEAELTGQIESLAGHTFNINSAQQLGTVLFEELKLPIVGHTKTGWSTSMETLERIENAHPIVRLVIRWRLLRRLRDFWVVALRRTIDSDGRVHSRSHPARSFSGHLVNTNPDLARVPGRTPEMQLIRRAFVAAPGHLLMSVDFNQLGLHVLAHVTRDPALVGPLRRRDDMHTLTAAAVLARPVDQLSVDDRQLGKVINFATFAGQGPSALALQLGVTPAEARELIARFDERYALVRTFQDEQLRLARERGYIQTLAGRHWPIGGLESLDPQVRSYSERLARRATHEGSVADVARRSLLQADRALRGAGLAAAPIVQVLDEVLFEVRADQLQAAARVASEAMRHAFELEAPLKVGVWAGPNWADLEELELDL